MVVCTRLHTRARARAALGGQQLMPAEASELLGQANVNYIMQRCVNTIAGLCDIAMHVPCMVLIFLRLFSLGPWSDRRVQKSFQ